MTRTLSILGSTGSIGRQSLDVIQQLGLTVAALTAHRDVVLMEEQARQVQPLLAVLTDEAAARDLKKRLADTPVRVLSGPEGLLEAAALPEADTVLTAVMGMVGLRPTLTAIEAGKTIALANKETLVCGGELVMAAAQARGVDILPVDSEHSAVFQCLQGCRDRGQVKRLILTASGGPFFGRRFAELENVAPAQALRHPNWTMGAKITIDSATMMNKGLECIEAMRLFDLPQQQVSVVIHRQSIVHSMVEFMDGAVLAQLGTADMRLPIQYALTWPDRLPCPAPALDLLNCGPLSFQAPDMEAFPCMALALEAARMGGTAPAVLNGANEAAVSLYLSEKIGFNDIYRRVKHALDTIPAAQDPCLEDIIAADQAARQAVQGVQA